MAHREFHYYQNVDAVIFVIDSNDGGRFEEVSKELHSLLKNKNCVLISDAGSPLISDPGYNLVQYCIANNIRVTSVPGPSSIVSSLQLSGLPISEFAFFGFVPKSKKKIEDLINKISQEERLILILNQLGSQVKMWKEYMISF